MLRLEEQNARRPPLAPGAWIQYAVQTRAARSSKHVAEKLGNHLSRDVINVLAAVLRDGLHRICDEGAKKGNGWPEVAASIIKQTRQIGQQRQVQYRESP